MPICTRCHARLEAGASTCTHCHAPVISVLSGRTRDSDAERTPAGAAQPAPEPHPEEGSSEDDRLVLLLEEPLPEVAAMIREFLENSGIACVIKGESIGLLYRLPLLGASFSGARVYVRASDFAEARELITHFFKTS